MNIKTSNHGFTITEILVAMIMSGIILTSVFSSFQSQQGSYLTQEQVCAMQQNLRAGLYLMEREIRMAGYDPIGAAGAGIQVASADTIRITSDITDDSGTGGPDGDTGDPGEDITYLLSDGDGDGDNDLRRNDVNGTGLQTLAENIDALNFVYLDEDGNQTSTLSKIRSIQISLLARTQDPERGYRNTMDYKNQQGTTIFSSGGDHFRRKFLTVEVKCRNLGVD
ncbi:MAG: PilW family protein [Deltaproteobacteria bacterium]|nr:PilW family protein [Deltaproteobacteria bacterium]